MKFQISRFALIIAILLSGLFIPASAVQASTSSVVGAETITGWFEIVWGDSQDGINTSTQYFIRTDDGASIQLSLGDEIAQPYGGILALHQRRITVNGTWIASAMNRLSAFQVISISFPGAATQSPVPMAVSGSQPWVSIMCKFSDNPAEPNNLTYFQGMYGTTTPGLDHYWREVSYNAINTLGSTASGWYTLPQPRSYYVVNNVLNLSRAATDCTHVADANIYYPPFVGVNLMFNDDLDGYAWGGSQYMTLDGVARSWRMTWEPPWGYSNVTVMAHEMGHGFGLPHSSGNYGQTYDNQWDVMSDTWTNCSNSSDLTYGCLGQHTISFHKDLLGWIPPEQKYIFPGGNATITLEQLALPQTGNYKLVQIPIKGSSTHFYTLEARRKTGYDIQLPGQAVIIHEVDKTRAIPAHVIDPDLNGNTGDAGAMWEIGETFSDPANGISVYISSTTSTGYQVTITTPSIPPGAFAKVSPANGALRQSTSPTLSWQPSSNTVTYEYCYDDINNNACDTNWVSVSGTSAALGGLINSSTYYWQVRAINPGGTTYANSGAWWNFKVVILPPNSLEPGTVMPASAEQLLSRRPTFVWEAVPGASSYTLEVSVSTTFATKAINKSLNSTSYTHIADLGANTVYYWRVKANATNGPSQYSQVRIFQTSNPPSTPVLAAPANNALSATNTPLLNWNDATVPAGTTFGHYEIQIASNNTFTALVTPPLEITGIANSQVITPALLNGATYYWRVRAFNTGTDGIESADDQYSSWSLVRSIRIAFAAPINLSVTGNPKPTFSWSPIEKAISYNLQVSKNNTFTMLIVNKVIYAPATSYTPLLTLTPGVTYYMRVRANGLYGPSPWSVTFQYIAP
jgi:hypothetical protein